MNLYLVQHGESKPKEVDPARPLSNNGAAAVRRVAEWSSQARLAVEEIRHSGKARAAETAELFAERLRPAHGVKAVTGLDPMDDVAPVATEVCAIERTLMLVGHLPFLSRLVGKLIAGDADRPIVKFQNAGVVCLSRSDGEWQVQWIVVSDLLPN